MPLFKPFAHYLGYLATDQETFRTLLGAYDGLIVPGTIAAWQQQGTGGFVMTLSATEHAPPYVIDPRFPLFQQALPAAKASHRALADLFGDSALVRPVAPRPEDFTEERLLKIAEHWSTFNTLYTEVPHDKTWDKYARRLNEEIERPSQREPPELVLPPYFAAAGTDDVWWGLSKQLFELTRSAGTVGVACHRVICAMGPHVLGELLSDVNADEQVVVWVSDLNELKADKKALSDYRTAIQSAAARGQDIFALYGGFFSVLLRAVGLRGSGHGVGFSEHRDWHELPESGAPPARYYLRRPHRYVALPFAQQLYLADPTLAACGCEHCGGRPPQELEYHDLMKHSVACRAEEIANFADLDAATAAEVLRDEHDAFRAQVQQSNLPPAISARATMTVAHLPVWADAITD